jgi:HAD superfamily hydrolase (TIGR01509 family)
MGEAALIQCVIFDVDGTLAETEEIHRRAFNRAFADFGLGWSWDVPLYRELLKVTGGKERVAHYCELEGVEALDSKGIAELHRVKTTIYAAMVNAGEASLRPGISAFIEALLAADRTLAIATTTSIPNIEALLGSALGSNWRDAFPVVAAGDMVARKKPAPDVYLLALEKLGLEPAQCVAIEDSRNGLRSAVAAGLQVIAVRSPYTSGDDLTGAAIELPDCRGLSMSLLDRLAVPARAAAAMK